MAYLTLVNAFFGRSWIPDRPKAGESPYDVNGSDQTIRQVTSFGVFPHPPMVGCVSGFLSQLDPLIYAQAKGRQPTGPGTGATYVPEPWVQQYYTLPKVPG